MNSRIREFEFVFQGAASSAPSEGVLATRSKLDTILRLLPSLSKPETTMLVLRLADYVVQPGIETPMTRFLETKLRLQKVFKEHPRSEWDGKLVPLVAAFTAGIDYDALNKKARDLAGPNLDYLEGLMLNLHRGTLAEQALKILFQFSFMGKTRDTRYDPEVRVVAFRKGVFNSRHLKHGGDDYFMNWPCTTPPADWDECVKVMLTVKDCNGVEEKTIMRYRDFAENKLWAKAFPFDALAWCRNEKDWMAETGWVMEGGCMPQAPTLQLPPSTVTVEDLDDAPSPWGTSGRTLQKEVDKAYQKFLDDDPEQEGPAKKPRLS